MLRRLSRFLLSLFVSTAVAAATDVDYRRVGHDHYFNLEYDQAISAYRQLLAQQPNDPTVFNHIASAILFKPGFPFWPWHGHRDTPPLRRIPRLFALNPAHHLRR